MAEPGDEDAGATTAPLQRVLAAGEEEPDASGGAASGGAAGSGGRSRLVSGAAAAGEAARLACGELRGALAAATVATVLLAAPLLFASGPTAAFVRPMALAFVLAVAAAMVVTLTVIPALAAVLLAAAPPGKRRPPLAGRVAAAYQRSLGGALRVPGAVLVVLCVAGLAGPVALGFAHLSQPQLQDRDLVVQWTGSPGMSLTEMNRVSAQLTSELLALPSVSDVGATIGRAVSSERIVDSNSGQIWITLKPSADYGSAVAAVRVIADGTPGIAGTVGTYSGDALNGVLTGGPSTVAVRIYGPDYGQLTALAGQIRDGMSKISGIRNPGFAVPVQEPTIMIAVNLDEAAKYGIAPGDVRRDVATLMSGLTVGNFFENEEVFDVVVMGTDSVRSSLTTVSNLVLDADNGRHVTLGQLAQVSVAPAPVDIQHDATSRYLDVTAQISGGGAVPAVSAMLGKISFPMDYNAVVTSGSAGGTTRQAEFLSYVIAALAGLVLLAQAALRSWRLAAICVLATAVPVAAGTAVMFGTGQFGAGQFGGASSFAAAAGLLAAAAIALRQFTRVLAAIGNGQGQAGLSAGTVTSGVMAVASQVTFSAIISVFLLVPFAVIGGAPGTELTRPAAIVALTGVVVATVISLFLLPAAYLRFGPKTANDAGLAPGGA